MSDCADHPYAADSAEPTVPRPRAIRFRGQDTLSLRQLDELNQVPKGTTFRRFKACRAGLVEGRDFFRLAAGEHAAFLATLREAGLIYPSSVHLVLLTEAGYRHLTGGSC